MKTIKTITLIALVFGVAILFSGCASAERRAREARVARFLEELEGTEISHFYQEQSFEQIISHLRKVTGLSIVYPKDIDKRILHMTFKAEGSLPDIFFTLMAADRLLWGFKGRTIYFGKHLSGLDFVCTEKWSVMD